MPGGGFLKQGADSTKYNRGLPGKEPHQLFEKRPDRVRERIDLREDITMSEELLRAIREEGYQKARVDIQKKLLAAFGAFVLLMIALVVIFW